MKRLERGEQAISGNFNVMMKKFSPNVKTPDFNKVQLVLVVSGLDHSSSSSGSLQIMFFPEPMNRIELAERFELILTSRFTYYLPRNGWAVELNNLKSTIGISGAHLKTDGVWLDIFF